MSSPVHHAKDLDAALMYAPPWVREQARQPFIPGEPPPIQWPPPFRRLDANAPHGEAPFEGDVAILALKRQLTLDPEMVPQPPRLPPLDRGPARILHIGAMVAGAALIASAITVVSLPILETAPGEAALPAAPVSVDDRKDDRLPAGGLPPRLAAGDHDGAVSEAADDRAGDGQVARPESRSTDYSATVAAASAPKEAAASAETHTLRLDADEITMLVKRGQDFLKNGDLASARLLLRRAAEGGSAAAAFALAASFDPLIIRQLGAIGAIADAARAREWYQKAVELGSPSASQRLEQLAQSAR
jgi:hypothetical protein